MDSARTLPKSCVKTFLAAGLMAAALMAVASRAQADTLIWSNGNDAGPNPGPVIQEFDADTGALLKSFADPAATPSQFGRGIAVVGSSIFYSLENSTTVFLTNTSGANLGAAFTVNIPGVTGIRSIASDGQFLYLTPESADLNIDQNVYKFDLAGNQIGAPVTLVPSRGLVQGPRDGLEIVGNTFIANQPRGDIGPYDQFDATTGNLITPAFLNPGTFGFTGVAFDGTFYYVFDDEADPSQLVVFDSSGGFVKRVTLTGLPGPNDQAFLSDLSAVVPGVPEPSGLTALVVGLAVFALAQRRRGRFAAQNKFS